MDRAALFDENQALASYFARMWAQKAGSYSDFDDYQQVALLALHAAAQSFDPARDSQFGAYAGVAMFRACRREHGRTPRDGPAAGGGRRVPCTPADVSPVDDADELAEVAAFIATSPDLTDRQRAVLLAWAGGRAIDWTGGRPDGKAANRGLAVVRKKFRRGTGDAG